MKELKPNAERGKMAIILLWTMVLLSLIIFVSEAMQYLMIQRYFETGEMPDGAADSNDLRQALAYIIYASGFIISAITFISWFRRAYYNLGMRVSKSKTDGWAAGAWFVPIISLFWPYQIMVEIYQKSIAYINSKHPGAYTYTSKTTVFVGWWWAIWIIFSVFDRVIARVSEYSETFEGLSIDSQLSMVSATLVLVSALLAIKVVTEVMEIEKVFHKVANEPDLESESDPIPTIPYTPPNNSLEE